MMEADEAACGGLAGVVELPGLAQHPARRGVKLPGQPIHDAARWQQRWIRLSLPNVARIDFDSASSSFCVATKRRDAADFDTPLP